MADFGHTETDKLIAKLEKRINKVYKQASKEMYEKSSDYFKHFLVKDKLKRDEVAAGLLKPTEYAEWRKGQLIVGDRWMRMRNQLAQDMHNTNIIARSIVDGFMPEAYALNFNFGTYECEIKSKFDTAFTLYNRESVENILRENPRLLPLPGKELSARIAAGKDVLWNEQQIQSVVLQGILQGESIPKIARRLRNEVSDSNRKASIRNARTMMTTAENAGRYDAYKRAEIKGIKMKKTWVATLDSRTRHEHRMLDGVTIPNDEPFMTSYGEIMYPGDPKADPAMIYNCRCTMIAQIQGFERDINEGRIMAAIKDDGTTMTYNEWKAAKTQSQNILHQEEVGENIRNAHVANYRRNAAEARRRLRR
jgi:SPP1 gp7 family putative phage head morphogenesis protein